VGVELLLGDCLDVLPTLPEKSVQCVVTSPPYFGLRDYGTAEWEGGDEECDHMAPPRGGRNPETAAKQLTSHGTLYYQYTGTCGKCGATRKDSQIGLESTVGDYVAALVAVFRQIKRVLRDDGTVWLNLGDSYATSLPGNKPFTTALSSGLPNSIENQEMRRAGQSLLDKTKLGVKPKSLLGIPWRVAFALQDDGWILRSDIIWQKPNPMPESIKDRPTKSHEYVFLLSKEDESYLDHEYIFLLTKQARYFYDADAIAEPSINAGKVVTNKDGKNGQMGIFGQTRGGFMKPEGVTVAATRNSRSVWKIATQPRKEAHFAAFPDELARRCVLAGTSAYGCCGKCGAPYARMTERANESNWHERVANGAAIRGSQVNGHISVHGNGVNHTLPSRISVTSGWQPTCKCGADVAPCVVMDPFAGRGTTLAMALQNGRNAVGIELNPAYLELARKTVGIDGN
jgi:DNA modification methylase